MSKVIGILGGISPASTSAYYDRLIAGYYQRRGDYYYPEIVVYSLNFQQFTDYEDTERERYIAEILKGIRGLERAGVDFIAMAANSPHSVFKEVAAQAKVPMLSIVETAAHEARQKQLRRLLLLGIQYTMQSSFYADTFREYGMSVISPSPDDQGTVNRIIFDELCRNIFKPETRQQLVNLIATYDVDGVILGCTELPLILRRGDLPIPGLDTLDLHVQAILDFAWSDS